MLEEHLTEEIVMEEVQKACDTDFFRTNYIELQTETKQSIELIRKFSRESLDASFLLLSSTNSLEHWSIRYVYLDRWWGRFVPGKKKAIDDLQKSIRKDRISQFVYQAINRLLENETLPEKSD